MREGMSSQVDMAFISWATHVLQRVWPKRKRIREKEQSLKNTPSSKGSLQLDFLKVESLVIVD